jgi:hypothetical protein
LQGIFSHSSTQQKDKVTLYRIESKSSLARENNSIKLVIPKIKPLVKASQ